METENDCMSIKQMIMESMKGTIFAEVGADVKGNYKSITISNKKKYKGVNWDRTLEKKGLAMIQTDSIMIAKYILGRVMKVMRSDMTDGDKTQKFINIVGSVKSSIQNKRLTRYGWSRRREYRGKRTIST